MFAAMVALALAGAHCSDGGGATASPDSGSVNPAPGLADAGECEGTARPSASSGASAEVPAEHRAVAIACSRTPLFSDEPGTSSSDGGGVACSSITDCQVAGGYCVQGQCGLDTCLSDADCGAGKVCVCGADAGGGNAIHTNSCVAANCRTDSDCGAGEYCSPSRGYCGGVDGYYCHTGADTCIDSTSDCACGGNACVYAPTVGHFVCGTNICEG
jgi:hypothetical protein